MGHDYVCPIGGAPFFFQGEDGIRDLVRSRGLGDVYKRQGHARQSTGQHHGYSPDEGWRDCRLHRHRANAQATVSYTHLTLPTSDLV